MSDHELPNVNFATIERMQLATKNPNAGPVFMLNLNKYLQRPLKTQMGDQAYNDCIFLY